MLKNQYSYINNKTYLIFGITQIGLLKVYLELPRLVHIVGSGNLVLMSVNGTLEMSSISGYINVFRILLIRINLIVAKECPTSSICPT